MKKLIFLCFLLAGCATGPSPAQREYDAFVAYTNSEVSAGRMTTAQANYLRVQKLNEVNARHRAAQQADMQETQRLMQQVMPMPRQPINCVNTGSGMTCF